MKGKVAVPFVIVLLLLIVVSGFISIKWYSFVFAKRVRGQILRVEKVVPEGAIITNSRDAQLPSQLFSFAVAIRDGKGEIHTASSEDRQWAVAEVGQCVEAKFFPFPFWQFDKANTYFGARLERLFDCKTIEDTPK